MTTLMTSTLPTIVGAGVVSRATDTMFGRHERKTRSAKSRRKTTAPRSIARGRSVKIRKGPRGGKYILRKGRKVYI